jgi:hypothetical protein
MADKMSGAQGPAAAGTTETKDELIKDAMVKTGELSDGALDQVTGSGGAAPTEHLKISLRQVYVTSYNLGGSHGD